MTQNTIYLSGPIENDPDGCAKWRNDIKFQWKDEVEFHDPVERIDGSKDDVKIVPNKSAYYRAMRDDNDYNEIIKDSEIVNVDKQQIRHSNGMLVKHKDVISRGTDMEIMYANERDIPIALWSNEGKDDLSIWLRYHVDHVAVTVSECMEYLTDNE